MARSHLVARVILIGVAVAVPLLGDLKIQIKTTEGSTTSSRTEYYKNGQWRFEVAPGVYVIADSATQRSIMVFSARREYSVNQMVRPLPATNPEMTFIEEIKTSDTGERRDLFGHTARHIITTEHRRAEYRNRPSAEEKEKEIVTEGWYLDIPGRFPGISRVGTVTMLMAHDSRERPRENFRIETAGRPPLGLPIWEKSPDRLLEVTDLSEEPLDATFFEAPPDFRRVVRPMHGEQLSWSDQLLLYWQKFEDWLGGLV
jgi:hypothetical protein